jgi:hypothetical protein
VKPGGKTMDNIALAYCLLIGVLLLYGLGFYLWGYHSAIKKATKDMEEMLEDCKEFEERGNKKCLY